MLIIELLAYNHLIVNTLQKNSSLYLIFIPYMKSYLFCGWFIFALLLSACGDTNNPTPEATFSERNDKGLVVNDDIDEASGLVVSHSNPNYLWTHNDSGDAPRIFLISNLGGDLGVYTLEGATHTDWEDMAIASRAGTSYLHIADFGDNNAQRSQVQIYRFPEPDVSQVNAPQTQTISSNSIEKIALSYPDGARNAEALLVNNSGDIYIITKENNKAGIYKASFPQSTTEVNTLSKLGELVITGEIVGGDAQHSILLKTYTQILYWEGTPQNNGQYETLLLQNTPVVVDNYIAEPQGEAIAWDQNEQGFYTLSEEPLSSLPARLYYYQKN